MAPVRPNHRRAVRTLIAALAAGAMVAALPGSAVAKPKPRPTVAPHVPGYGQVAPPRVTPPATAKLPKRTGKVAVTTPRSTSESKTAAKALSATATTLAGLNDKVALRALIVATNTDDFGVPTWKTTLDRLGASYDVLYDSTSTITTDTLVRADGTGKY